MTCHHLKNAVFVRYIDQLFGGARGLNFVEIGGLDGEKYSNTLLLERERGWRGLLVEANPFTFAQMKQKDRACYMAHACVSVDTKFMNFKIAGSVTAAVQTMAHEHASRVDSDIKAYGHLKQWEGSGTTQTTRCFPFEEIVLRAADLGGHIDFFSLDVEGAEMHILESLDWGNVTIDVIMVEEDKVGHKPVQDLLHTKGYRQVAKLGLDAIYVRKEVHCLARSVARAQVVCEPSRGRDA